MPFKYSFLFKFVYINIHIVYYDKKNTYSLLSIKITIYVINNFIHFDF